MSIRWQDWVTALSGCWLLVSPWQMDYVLNLEAKGNACGIGVGLIIFNLISASRKVDAGQEIVNILMGIWLILSPFALGFSSEKKVMLNAVVVGFIVITLAVWQLFDAIKSKKKDPG